MASTNRESAKLGFILLAIFVRRVSKRNQLRLFFGKQLDNLPPCFIVLLSEQLPAEVLDIHLRDVYTLVHGDLALRWSGRKKVTLIIEKSKRRLLDEKIGDLRQPIALMKCAVIEGDSLCSLQTCAWHFGCLPSRRSTLRDCGSASDGIEIGDCTDIHLRSSASQPPSRRD